MFRRDFLKLTGLLSSTLVVRINPVGKVMSLPVEVASQGKLYRGTADGKILISANAGRSWQLHTNFGAEFSIFGLETDHRDQVRAQLGFAGHSFELALAQDSKIWRTV